MDARDRSLLVAILACMLAACGGGGGGKEPPPPRFTATTSVSSGGAIAPTVATVNQGATITFLLTPDAGFEVVAVSGCGGTLTGRSYTTAPMNANCIVTATFRAEDPAERWTELAPYPCPGTLNRTDALLVEDEAIWTGCGTNAQGFGLFLSDDDGETWARFAPANEVGYFDNFRVNSITRSADGKLYVAGIGQPGNRMVASVSAADAVQTELVAGMAVGTNFTVGHFARDAAGRAIATSLNSFDAMMRASDAEAFQPLNPFTTGASHRFNGLVLHAGSFHGAGSTIVEPPLYFRPATQLGIPVAFAPTQLAANVTGEMWGLAVAGDVTVLAGVDQVNGDGMIFRVRGDSITAIRVSELLPGIGQTWMRGACAGEGQFAVVGHLSPDAGAIVLLSGDGLAWEEITMADAPRALQRCQFHDSQLYVAGSDGYVARYPLD